MFLKDIKLKYWVAGLGLLVLVAIGSYVFMQLNPPPAPADGNGLKTYKDEEIGVAFEYPEEWGTIEAEREEVCTPGLEGPFGSEEAAEEKRATGDPCISIYLGTSDSGFHRSLPLAFFYAQTPLFAKYQPGRGGNWTGAVSQIKSASDIENYCVGVENCSVYTNTHGIRIAKKFENTEGMGSYWGWKYFIVSPHQFFPVIIVGSSGAIDDPKHQDFDALVNSIQF